MPLKQSTGIDCTYAYVTTLYK